MKIVIVVAVVEAAAAVEAQVLHSKTHSKTKNHLLKKRLSRKYKKEDPLQVNNPSNTPLNKSLLQADEERHLYKYLVEVSSQSKAELLHTVPKSFLEVVVEAEDEVQEAVFKTQILCSNLHQDRNLQLEAEARELLMCLHHSKIRHHQQKGEVDHQRKSFNN
jgi:hypothetical protein